MTGYSVDDFVEGYNQLNACKFSDLTYAEISKLIKEYGDIDPMISQLIQDAYAKVALCPFELSAMRETLN